MKLDNTRVTETINFIDNNTALPQARRQAVAQFCRQTFPRLALFDFGAYKTEFQTLSGEMSVKQHATVPAGNAAQRMTRRAIMLIWTAMSKTMTGGAAVPAQAKAAMTMPTGNLAAALADTILKASVVASPGTAADVFTNEVMAHPRRFLAAHKVIVLGTPAGAATFTNLHSPSFRNVRQFYFQYDCGNDRFVFNAALDARFGSAHPFQTVSVPAVNWYDVPGNGGENAPMTPANFSQILGCELAGATVMVTTQFTGCTFCWTNQGGLIRAAHIGPTKAGYPSAVLPTSYPGLGNGVAQRMIGQGAPVPVGLGVAAGMANAAGVALNVFGKGAGNAPAINGGNPFYPVNLQYATIIGREQNGAWKFYLQVIALNTGQIAEARRIM